MTMQHKTGFTLMSLLLLTLCTGLGVRAFYTYALGRLSLSQTGISPVVSPVIQETTQKPRKFYQPIIERNLFGHADQTQDNPIPMDIDALNQTGLDLKLWGTVIGLDDEAWAVIETGPGRSQHLFRTGDIVHNAKIRQILKDKVILDGDGKMEVLDMQKWETASRQSPGPLQPPQPTDNQNRIQLKRNQIDEAIQDINALMKQVRIIPNFTQGKPDGLKVTGVMTGSFFSQIGLQSGDIILGVDGKPIESVDDALKIYTGMKTADSVRLNLRRGSRDQIIEYGIE
ncbi:MAG TPA: type II secretion system protein N [Desulfatirhabdiaceae bacterium]|nr:type II secretion system protein N [Desulfatirhabdiaceae bacterium]